MTLFDVLLPAVVGCVGLCAGMIVEDARAEWIDPVAVVIYSGTLVAVVGVAVVVVS